MSDEPLLSKGSDLNAYVGTAANTSSLYLSSGGTNVGIGITAPTVKLTVKVGDTVQIAQFLSEHATNNEIFIGQEISADHCTVLGFNHAADIAYMQVGGDNQGTGIVIKKGGYVGIGNTNPSKFLTVQADFGANTYGDILSLEQYSGGSGAGAGMRFRSYISGGGHTAARIKGVDAGNYKGDLAFEVSNQVALGDTTTEAIRVKGDGKVGIGTSIPGEKLQVNGNIKLVSGNIILNGNWLSGDGGNEGVFIDSAGKVGIGTSAPSVRFQVNSSGDGDGIRLLDNAAHGMGEIMQDNTSYNHGEFNLYYYTGSYVVKTIKMNGYGESYINPPSPVVYGLTIGATTAAFASKLYVKGYNDTSSNYAFVAVDSSDNPIIFARNDGKVGIGNTSLSIDEKLHVYGNIKIETGSVLKIGSNQVVGAQQSAISNATTTYAVGSFGATSDALNELGTKINSILNALRPTGHGLIAS
ncbi:MAG: hypothetical protein A2297_04690 [Elusimicrobia bacterium RIFOXYB2_FULL_48_7]|nr:MAG: hypothetical protein A2297_04690 [Elusimicrobia bacterium RIFOXYB2_FULL_48_7]